MKNSNHIFDEFGICVKCYIVNNSDAVEKFSCEQLLAIDNTHTWKHTYGDNFICTICNINGSKMNDSSICVSDNQLYTCNEWLMIKANE